MDLSFTKEEMEFRDEVRAYLADNLPERISDAVRRGGELIKEMMEEWHAILQRKGWLATIWPKEYGGQEIEGVYEYILNEALSKHAAPQIGKGVGIIGKTLIAHGSDKLKAEFLQHYYDARGTPFRVRLGVKYMF